jgi:6-phosphogluconolactonase
MHFFFGDERAVPSDHADSNFRMASEALLKKVPIPEANIHRVETERGATEAAALYEQAVRAFAGPGPGTPRLDLILLGMGPDGHTASLFPDTTALQERSRLVVGNFVPKLNADRITFTYPLINAGKNVWFLTAGAEKAPMLRNILMGSSDGTRYPAQEVQPAGENTLVWWVDEDAARGLEA